jgi:hypothetical protein
LIKDNAEVLLYYFTDNGRKFHSKFKDEKPQIKRIKESCERIKKCLDNIGHAFKNS